MKVRLSPLIAASTLVFTLGALAGCSRRNEVPFNQAQWLKANEYGDSVRLAMVSHLITSHHLKQLSRSDVNTLLGPPEKYSDMKQNEDWYLVHVEYSGIDPSDISHLVLRFDTQSGKIVECGINRLKKGHAPEFKLL